MVYCSSCGVEISEEFRFCSQCGVPAGASAVVGLSAPLRRSRDNKKIAGVCGGLGRHLGIDPTLVRLIMVCAAFWGFGIVLYLLCWFVMPADPYLPLSAPMRPVYTRPARS